MIPALLKAIQQSWKKVQAGAVACLCTCLNLIGNDNGQIKGIIRYWLLAVLGKESKYFS